MKHNTWFKTIVLFHVLSILLVACASPMATLVPETSVPEASPPATQEPTEEAPPAPSSTPDQSTGLRPIGVTDVQVQIGEGSPTPFDVFVSGTWPDLCAQLAQVEQRLSEGRVDITLLATPEEPDCPADMVGLPFRMAIPVNVVEMPANLYTIAVNGVETAVQWDIFPASGGMLPEAQAGDLLPIEVAEARVEIGNGSPVPVDVFVSGVWPGLCSQLARLEQRFSEGRIEIDLLATPGDPDCPPDLTGNPFRIAVPLNMLEAPLGQYTLLVNGFETAFEWTGASSEPAASIPSIAYIGPDGNLWVLESGSSAPRQLSQDAAPVGAGSTETAVSYYFPSISSDGRYVAIRRDVGTPISEGYAYEFGLWVYDLTSGDPRQVYDRNPAGFDWKPGTHLLAYGLGVDENYFATRGQPDASLANGIWWIDLDSGEAGELVSPERGYALYSPTWSPDGRYIGFDELLYYEGRGPFAYYDLDAGQYVASEAPLGTYAWSPDSSLIAYDYLTYSPSGEERIFVRPFPEGEERLISSGIPDGGYAQYPAFSPEGERIAYLAALGGPDDYHFSLYVQDLGGEEARDLGRFESVWKLQWTPDGESLVFSAGPYESMQMLLVSVVDGTVSVLADGQSPDVAGG